MIEWIPASFQLTIWYNSGADKVGTVAVRLRFAGAEEKKGDAFLGIWIWFIGNKV